MKTNKNVLYATTHLYMSFCSVLKYGSPAKMSNTNWTESQPNSPQLTICFFFFIFLLFSIFFVSISSRMYARAYTKLQMCSYVLTVFWIYINKVRKGKGGKLMCWGWLLLSHMSVCLSLLCWTWTAHVNSDFGEWNNTKKNQHVIFLKLNSTENMHISW